MGYRYKRGSPQFRQLLGTLLVAWSLVTGCAAVFASAVYYNTKDLTILIAWLGGPFIVGTVLIFLVALAGWSTNVKDAPGTFPTVSTDIRVRKDIHGLKKRVK